MGRYCFLLILLLGSFRPISVIAQETDLITQARTFTSQKDYSKASDLYKKAYDRQPGDNDIYTEYLATLLATKDYKTAEKLVNNQHRYNNSPLLLLDLGQVFAAAGQTKKAEEQYETAIQNINGDDILTQKMATKFSEINRDDYAIKTYERTRELLHYPYLYTNPLSLLYAKAGNIENAVSALLDTAPGQPGGTEDTKASMLRILGNDPKKLQIAQKTLVKKINQQPENTFFSELLTWLYAQKGDWDGALLQIEAIDERNRENGQRLIEFSTAAKKENQYDIALKSLDAVTAKGKDLPYYGLAKAEKLNTAMQQIENDPFFTPEKVAALKKEYEGFFVEFPQYTNTPLMLDFARLEAQYNNDPQHAIAILQEAIAAPGTTREFTGKAKLQLGDYQVLVGKIWEASLTYSQVDKDFKQDALGEEARFRNGKLAYYRGDFDWAQGQLSVLKASTSELIANDALYLSVLITENTPKDSNMVPLRRFAYADLLLFQNKDNEAKLLLDSLTKAFPKNALNDDILMLQATIAQKHREYPKALDYLKQIYEQYAKDVLADDAVFKTADIYERLLHQPDQAKKFYEQLIIDFPGSTYVQSARTRLQQLQANTGTTNP